MSFPSNDRLFTLYRTVAEQLTEEQIEILLRRAGEEPTGQEVKDVSHRIRTLIQGYVEEKQ
jgi:hypothetical protein